MPLITRSQTELLEESRRNLRSTTTITNTAPGGTAGALLEIASTEHASIHRQLESLQRDLFLSTASGDALDRIGDLLGTTRGQSTRAFDDSRNVRLRIDPTTGEVASSLIRNRLTGIRASATGTPREDEQVTTTGFVIVEGTTLTSNTGATYLTTQDVVFVNARLP